MVVVMVMVSGVECEGRSYGATWSGQGFLFRVAGGAAGKAGGAGQGREEEAVRCSSRRKRGGPAKNAGSIGRSPGMGCSCGRGEWRPAGAGRWVLLFVEVEVGVVATQRGGGD